jgi:molybdate transport system regulatory protein
MNQTKPAGRAARPGRLQSRSLGTSPSTTEAAVKLSARNKLDGTVTSITKGEAIANVAIDVGGQRLVASITVEAVDELGLAEGTAVTAVVKASDVILATGD